MAESQDVNADPTMATAAGTTLSLRRETWEGRWTQRSSFGWYSSHLPAGTEELLRSSTVAEGPAMDVGCGDGVLTSKIAESGRRTVGVDFSAAAIRRASEANRDRPNRPSFAVASAVGLPFGRQSFTFVFDRGCMHNLPPSVWQSYLADVERVLVPRGVFELRYTGQALGGWRARLGLRLRQLLGRARPHRLTQDRLLAILPAALRILETDREPFAQPDGHTIYFDHFVIEKRAE